MSKFICKANKVFQLLGKNLCPYDFYFSGGFKEAGIFLGSKASCFVSEVTSKASAPSIESFQECKKKKLHKMKSCPRLQ